MAEQTDDLIQAIKITFAVETDEELAKALQIGRSTISSWRLRGSVPKRYLMRKPGDPQSVVNFPPLEWGQEEQAAFTLAMARFIRTHGHAFETYRQFLEHGASAAAEFWVIHQDTKGELVREMNARSEGQSHPMTVMQIMAYDDFNTVQQSE